MRILPLKTSLGGDIDRAYHLEFSMSSFSFFSTAPWVRCTGVFLLSSFPLLGNVEMKELETLTSKWIEVEKTRSLETSDGEYQIETLQHLQTILKDQVADWKSQVEKLESTMGRSDEERQKLLAVREELDLKREGARQRLGRIVRVLRRLEARLPQPLREELEVPFRRMALERKEDAWMDHAISALTVLKSVRGFHHRVTFAHQDIQLEGKELTVQVIYLGLTRAYFASLDGERVGVGTPGEDGWRWKLDSSNADEIRHAIVLAQGESSDLRLVQLPVEVKR